MQTISNTLPKSCTKLLGNGKNFLKVSRKAEMKLIKTKQNKHLEREKICRKYLEEDFQEIMKYLF